jgi:hypothetical protein
VDENINLLDQVSEMSNQQLNARLAIIGDMALELRQELKTLNELEAAIRTEMGRRCGRVTAGESI